MEATPHPIDFDAYGRGDVVSIEDIKAAAEVDGVDPKDEGAVRLYCLALRDRIQRHRVRTGQGLASVRISKEGIRILNDGDEQSLYCEEDTQKALSRVVRRYRELAAVDVGLLSDPRRKRHQEMLVKSSRIIGASGYPRSKLPQLPEVVGEE